MTKWIYSFEEGSANDKDLLGGKGANLAEMSRLGLPVPPGFTITTQSCINSLDNPDFFDSTLKEDILKAVTHWRKKQKKPSAEKILTCSWSLSEAEPNFPCLE